MRSVHPRFVDGAYQFRRRIISRSQLSTFHTMCNQIARRAHPVGVDRQRAFISGLRPLEHVLLRRRQISNRNNSAGQAPPMPVHIRDLRRPHAPARRSHPCSVRDHAAAPGCADIDHRLLGSSVATPCSTSPPAHAQRRKQPVLYLHAELLMQAISRRFPP